MVLDKEQVKDSLRKFNYIYFQHDSVSSRHPCIWFFDYRHNQGMIYQFNVINATMKILYD